MARTTGEITEILKELYDEEFGGDECESFQLSWCQLRKIAGVERLTDDIISNIGKMMLDSGYALVTFDDFFLVAMEANFRRTRKLPARIAEKYLAVSNEELADDDGDQEIEDDDI